MKRNRIICTIISVLFIATLKAQTPPDGLNCTQFRTWAKDNFYTGKFVDLSYDGARGKMYGYIDINRQDSTIECIYSGFQTKHAPQVEVTEITDKINTEHTVPQSLFNNLAPMLDDIHHLFPVYPNHNSLRSNHPFKEIDDNTTTKWVYLTNQFTSKPANSELCSEFKSSQWEPRESRKGDIARAVAYFFTVYPTAVPGGISSVMDETLLLQWNELDPVDAIERRRDSLIFKYQKNHNPYVLHPEWVIKAFGNTCAVSVQNQLIGFNNLNLFPNPTSNKIQLSGFVEEQKQVQLDVLNIVGQLLYSEKIDLKYGKFEHEINTSSFESGAYFIRLSDNESQVSKLFFKN
ncbi:MAG: endonuclease [Bacteroidetes bacterium]|nr:endonuclease [Bacteroidota bacterium]MBP7256649.1 endonuclease [Chitinophagales bacterium]MBK7139567.1 endonuclease [Bacteroidota bacterium]MBK7638775.1 endonuclease [Bacteroidota bacterium]MBK8672487.1 endonuclease [Bacteroidota bacterium]